MSMGSDEQIIEQLKERKLLHYKILELRKYNDQEVVRFHYLNDLMAPLDDQLFLFNYIDRLTERIKRLEEKNKIINQVIQSGLQTKGE